MDNLFNSEEKLLQLTSAVEQSPAEVFITDTEGNIQYVNPRFCRLTGYSREEVLGKSPKFLQSGKTSHEQYKQLWETIKAGGEWRGEICNKKKNGELFWESASISAVKDSQGRIISFIKIAEDITGRKRIDQMKDEFVSMVSHELRTPLSITKEGVSLVLDKIPGPLNNKQEKILLTARDNIDRLARIINSLLDISKIEAGRMQIKREQVDIISLIDKVVLGFKAKAEAKGVEFKVNIPAKILNIYVDADRLFQVFTNLISNAVKFTDKGDITVSCEERESEIECFVADTGIGISSEDIPKVFSKFQQFGRVAGAGEKGTGLGLSIAKSIIEIHNGRMWVESQSGKGSRFTFTLPRYNAEQLFREAVEGAVRQASDSNEAVSFVLVSLELPAEDMHTVRHNVEQVLKRALRRDGDLLVKDTGDIIVILEDCGKAEVLRIEGRLEQALSDYIAQETKLGEIKFKVGVSTYPQDGRTFDELMKKARYA